VFPAADSRRRIQTEGHSLPYSAITRHSSLSNTQRGALIGAGAGGAVGAVVGNAAGSTAKGAIIGAVVGGGRGRDHRESDERPG